MENWRYKLLWLILGLMVLLFFSVFTRQQSRAPEVVFSEFWAAVDRGEIMEVTIQGQNIPIQGKYQNGESFRTFAPNDPYLVKTLRAKEVRVAAKTVQSPWYVVLLMNWAPMLLLVGVWIFFMRGQVGGGVEMKDLGRRVERLEKKVGI